MKRSSILVLAIVFLVFFGIQGWLVLDKHWFPIAVEAEQALLKQESMDVGTPVAGIVWDVRAEEGSTVQRGQYLFVIIPQTPTDPHGGRPVFIPALRSGMVMDIGVVPGEFVQASKKLASIVDTSPDAQYVFAVLPVEPDQWMQLRPNLQASVKNRMLSKGTLDAEIVSVSPVYNAKDETAEVKLKLTDFRAKKDWVPTVGMPVEVSIALENESEFKGWVKRIAQKIAPTSFAGSE